MRCTGALCIICGCGYAGLKAAGTYSRRVEVLRNLQNGFSLLETEISYSSTPLPVALRRAGEKLDKITGSVFGKAAALLEMNRGYTAGEAWEEAVSILAGESFVRREEMSVLLMFGHGLGNSAREEQLKNIALTREQLRIIEKKALENRDKNTKMWQYMGFCLGIIIVLVLI